MFYCTGTDSVIDTSVHMNCAHDTTLSVRLENVQLVVETMHNRIYEYQGRFHQKLLLLQLVWVVLLECDLSLNPVRFKS